MTALATPPVQPRDSASEVSQNDGVIDLDSEALTASFLDNRPPFGAPGNRESGGARAVEDLPLEEMVQASEQTLPNEQITALDLSGLGRIGSPGNREAGGARADQTPLPDIEAMSIDEILGDFPAG